MQPSDIETVFAIQAACYPSHLHEDTDCLESLRNSSPESCFVAVSDDPSANNLPIGYFFTHPGHADRPHPLRESLHPMNTTDFQCLYLHDLAVHPESRSQRVGEALIAAALRAGQQMGYSTFTCVALESAVSFWKRNGFTVRDDVPVPSEYGNGAKFMSMSQ
jgi:ribosomal protein S18 acetylase RimI-like enzyme